ncbi:MAG TPA: hypothetical protein VFA45_22685 [Actinomycetes bacterium]|nr:hypothetical protein [Actinomycetes bacterium]
MTVVPEASTTPAPVDAPPPPPGPIGPPNPAAPRVCPSPSDLGLLIAAPFGGGFGLQNLIGSGLSGSGLGASLGEVIEHVRDLGGQAKSVPSETPSGADPSPLPKPDPAPPPAPPAPAEQSSGSSVSASFHTHHKGGSSYAILGGMLFVLFLRPLALSRLASSSGFSRSFRPLALPG